MIALCALPHLIADERVSPSQSPRPEAQTILERTGISGGLCLTLGARSPAFAEALAESSALYVQVLQPDHDKACTWGFGSPRGTDASNWECAAHGSTRTTTTRNSSTSFSYKPPRLTQAVAAYGLVVVSDIDGQRIVALDAATGRELEFSYDLLIKGNSIPRTNEDNWGGFRRRKFGRRLDARVPSFDDTATAAYTFQPKGEGWANLGTLHLMLIGDDPAKPLWKSDPIELVVSDMVLTPRYIYCVGHYQRIRKSPELWVVAREHGAVVNRTSVGGFPALLGMSAAGGRLLIATREGKLVCFECK